MNEIGSWWFSLEMRKLRLRQNIKALYLYDLVTEEQMLLYKRGKVTIQDEYILTTTIDSRIEVWILWTIQPKPNQTTAEMEWARTRSCIGIWIQTKENKFLSPLPVLGLKLSQFCLRRKVRFKVNAEESILLKPI